MAEKAWDASLKLGYTIYAHSSGFLTCVLAYAPNASSYPFLALCCQVLRLQHLTSGDCIAQSPLLTGFMEGVANAK